ncbi:nlpC/P60 family protein [Lactobacillus delbrueckii subsp. delbrueckii DSM 20074 = JCM 1012]|nr:nlpC/P60 family protein [Lactobacillus delbrueckii subsp. delbrueckii DSM 20074 = JCM 1012]
MKKTRVAYNKGNKVNTWTTYGAGKKLAGQVKSGYKFTATGQA